MTVRCAQCGEEMLGAVNRCWKCGQKLVANAEQPELPPLRTSARPELLAADAEVLDSVDEVYAAVSAESNLGNATQQSLVLAGHAPPSSEPPVVAHYASNQASVPVTTSATSGYQYPADHPSAATGGAYGALLLGIAALIASVFTVIAAVLALPGLALGAWGSSSNRRGTARIGMLLCFLALLLSSCNGAVWIYTIVYGHSPWETVPEGYEQEIDSSWEDEEF